MEILVFGAQIRVGDFFPLEDHLPSTPRRVLPPKSGRWGFLSGSRIAFISRPGLSNVAPCFPAVWPAGAAVVISLALSDILCLSPLASETLSPHLSLGARLLRRTQASFELDPASRTMRYELQGRRRILRSSNYCTSLRAVSSDLLSGLWSC